MARKAAISVLGDATSYLRSLRESAAATDHFEGDLKKLAVTAKASAEAQIQASVRKTERLRSEAAAFHAAANAEVKGSQRQAAAANLAAAADARLARAMGVTNRETLGLRRGFGGIDRDVNRFSRGVLAGSGALGHFSRAAIFASNSVLGGVGLAFALRQIISSASRIQEETEKTGVVFGRSANGVQAWAGSLATSFGVGEGAALEAAGTFGNMFHSLRVGEGDAAKMSKRLVELAADMASFNNASPADTLQALQSGLAGQVRPLRQFGVFLSQDRIKAEAYGDGIAKAGSKLNAHQKVLAAYNIILKDTGLQQGDVARNTGSLSVSQSKLRASLEDSEAIIGRALLPSLVGLTNQFATYLDRLNKTGSLQRDVNTVVKDARDVFHGLDEASKPVIEGFRLLSRLSGGTTNAVKILGGAFLLLEARAKLIKWGLIESGIAGIGGNAATASGKVETLATRLGSLARLGVITVGIEVLIHRKQVGDAIGDFVGDKTGSSRLGHAVATFEKTALGFLAGDSVNIINNALKGIGGGGGNGLGNTGLLPNPGLQFRPRRTPQPASTALTQAGRPLSLAGRFNLAELRLASAEAANQTRERITQLTIEAAIVRQEVASAKTLKDKTTLSQQLSGILSKIRGFDEASAQAAKQAVADTKQLREENRKRLQDALQAREFRVLGLDPSGQAFTPGIKALRKELGSVDKLIKRTSLNTTKNKGLLGRIDKLLFGKDAARLTKDVRSTVKQMLDGMYDELKSGGGPQTRFQKPALGKLTAGLGLDNASRKEFAARLSRLQAGGTVPAGSRFAGGGGGDLVVHTHVHLGEREVGSSVTKHQQKTARRNPPQRRGPHAGGGV